MSKYATDTMALVLYLEKRKLPKTIAQIFQNAEIENSEIVIPSIVITEIGYLLDNQVIQSAFSINDIPELHDRLITGTSKLLNLALITNDPVITNSKHIRTVWK